VVVIDDLPISRDLDDLDPIRFVEIRDCGIARDIN